MSDGYQRDDKQPDKSEVPPTASFDGSRYTSGLGPGSRIGQFRIEQELGRGGAGIVYLAQDTKLDRRVAIKSMPAELAKSPVAQSRFRREAKLLASLNHPNIATIHDVVEQDEDTSFLVLEYVAGETLAERIDRGTLEPQEALVVGEQIVQAIAAAHEHGVIHRDLKPSNIRITSEGNVKVLDFGIAKAVDPEELQGQTSLTQTGRLIGTPAYMSPEQLRGDRVDKRSDIWSFGCILYEMLIGKSACAGEAPCETLASMLKSEPRLDIQGLRAAPHLGQIIGKCLKTDPGQRYQSADDLHEDLRRCRDALKVAAPKAVDIKALYVRLRQPWVAACVVLVTLLLLLAAAWLVDHRARVRWARSVAIPQITDLIRQDKYAQAFSLAQQVERRVHDDPMLARLWREMSREYSISTTPSGAAVFYKEYSDMQGEWEYLGRTPLTHVRLPFGAYRWKITKVEFVPVESIVDGYRGERITIEIALHEEASLPPEMVPIESKTFTVASAESDGYEDVKTPPYAINKYEVTNEQFKRFVDAGGYADRKYWKHRFVDHGRELTWEEAMDRFRDKTHRPGPSTWEGGAFPKGQERYPVSGVSWYEAAAFAEFTGKSLPTVHHWRAAACLEEGQVIVDYSNFGLDGTCQVGTHKGIGSTGVYDMAGNVKEWCWNAVDDLGTRRYILGGSWGEPTYMFTDADTKSPLERKETFGFRCAFYYRGGQSIPSKFFDAIQGRPVRDYGQILPVSEELFTSWLNDLYRFDRDQVNAARESVDESSPYWRREKIRFDTVYEQGQVIAYLFLPKGVGPPYQPVVYFPGVGAQWRRSSDKLADFMMVDFIIKSGRAVLYPVYKGTYERQFSIPRWDDLTGRRDYGVDLSKDLRRSIDYLQTRRDIDIGTLTYCGFSWGAALGPIIVAVEDRIKFALFVDGGFWSDRQVLPSADPVHFAPRVRVPVLMVNGREDFTFPYETSQQPMYRLLGSADKEHSLHPGGHGLFGLFGARIKDGVLQWLDEHLGPVE
ncbi:MAG: protein kinase [Phycisphaerales bacterium]|nr:MAG: protein kinase [Phycisphaerales bacterium]